MGHVYADVVLSWRRSKRVRAFVDTGATYSVIPEGLAGALGLPEPTEGVRVRLADGSKRTLPLTVVKVRVDGREAGAVAVVTRKGEPLLGAEALEGLGLAVDPKRGRLVPTRPYAVRIGGYARRSRRR